MEPPLKSRVCGLGHLLQLARMGLIGHFSHRNAAYPLIEHCRVRRNGNRFTLNLPFPHSRWFQIGPRRQGFASPLRALDGSGPIRRNGCSRGKGGGLRAVRQFAFAPTGRTGLGCAMFTASLRRARFVPTQGSRQSSSARLRRLSLDLAFVGPARHRLGRRFPTASGFGRFPPFAGERKTLTNP